MDAKTYTLPCNLFYATPIDQCPCEYNIIPVSTEQPIAIFDAETSQLAFDGKYTQHTLVALRDIMLLCNKLFSLPETVDYIKYLKK